MFRFNWKLTLFTALMLPFMVSLGFWQLDREQQKRDMQARYETRLAQSPAPLSTVNWQQQDLGWMQVTADGYFDNRRQFLLDNRIYESQVGYEVLTPLRTDYGVLLVNRGWIAQGPTRQRLPAIPQVDEKVAVEVTLYVPDGNLLMLAEDVLDGPDWPKVVQKIDIPAFADVYGEAFLPVSARLQPGEPGALPRDWPVVNMRAETHRGYAVQWFIMSLVLVVLYFMFSFRRSES